MREQEDWYWACEDDEPALNKFIIENGRESLWRRVRVEIRADERVSWMPIHQGKSSPTIEDILDLAIHTVPMYRVNHNRFVFEAAKIPIFARFLRNAKFDLCNYVSNGLHRAAALAQEPYSDDVMRSLGRRINATLGIDEDWF